MKTVLLALLTVSILVPLVPVNASVTQIIQSQMDGSNNIGTFFGTYTTPCGLGANRICGWAQGFLVPNNLDPSYVLNYAVFHLSKIGTPTCTMRADIYTASVQSNQAIPSSTTPLVSSGTIACSAISSAADYTFTFTGANRLQLVLGTYYVLGIVMASNATQISGSSTIQTLGSPATNPFPNGMLSDYNAGGGAWVSSASSQDLAFQVAADAPSITTTLNSAAYAGAFLSFIVVVGVLFFDTGPFKKRVGLALVFGLVIFLVVLMGVIINS